MAEFLRGRLALAALAWPARARSIPQDLWFAIWLRSHHRDGAAPVPFLLRPRRRRFAAWAFTAGPLAGRLTLMDPAWLEALAEKEYLFPLRWPLSAWVTNLAYIPIILLVYRRRAGLGLVSAHERGMVIGCLSLAAVFLVALALNAARVTLAIQLQPARTFWMLDFTATLYAVWALADGGSAARLRPVAAAAALIVLAIARGGYVMTIEFPDRPLFEAAVPGDWGRVAAWAQGTPKATAWPADPMHAARDGTSLRMSAGRGVFVRHQGAPSGCTIAR